jgi:hypothetical protein
MRTLKTCGNRACRAGGRRAHGHGRYPHELASRQAQLEAVAEEIGHFSGLRAEEEGFRRIKILLEALSTTPATSLAGVAGKLDAMMREGGAWEECSSAFPLATDPLGVDFPENS